MKKTVSTLGVALMFAVVTLGFTGSASAQAEMKGLWRTDDMPKTLWVVQEIVLEDEDMLALFWLDKVSKSAKDCTGNETTCDNRAFDWSVLIGPEEDGVWKLVQAKGAGYRSNTKMDWEFVDDDNATATLRRCADGNCGDFKVGDVLDFERVYGEEGNTPDQGDTKTGTWDGQTSAYEACFNIDSSGDKITTNGSDCENGNSYEFELEDGVDPDDNDDCNFDFYGKDTIQINNGKFSYSERFSGGWHNETKYVTGTIEGDRARGTLKKVDHKWGNHCEGTWEAKAPLGSGVKVIEDWEEEWVPVLR